jgi:hypothetical protein
MKAGIFTGNSSATLQQAISSWHARKTCLGIEITGLFNSLHPLSFSYSCDTSMTTLRVGQRD